MIHDDSTVQTCHVWLVACERHRQDVAGLSMICGDFVVLFRVIYGDSWHASRVRHATGGEGTVMSVEDDKLTVLFDNKGYKTLALDVVLAQGLLEQR